MDKTINEPSTAGNSTNETSTTAGNPTGHGAAGPSPIPQFSTAALLFGAAIFGLGVGGVVDGTSPLGWGRSAPIGFVAGGLIATIGLIVRWRRVSP